MSSVSPVSLATSAYRPARPTTRPVQPSVNHFGKQNLNKDGDRFERLQVGLSLNAMLEAKAQELQAFEKASKENWKPVIFANADTPYADYAANPVKTGGLVAALSTAAMTAMGSLRSRQGALLTTAVGLASGLWAGVATKHQNKEILSRIV